MANIQYIGARYVPKFYENPDDESNNWKAGVPYDPLTVVTYQDNSYTSKKPVPATVSDPASEPSYWVLTANYSAAIEGLQEEISDINALIGDVPLTYGDTLINCINDANQKSGDGLDCIFKNIVTKPQVPYFTAITGGTTYKSLQGVAYDSKRNRLCLGIIVGAGGDGIFVIVDYDDITDVIITKEYDNATVGHINCFCYDPESDKYLVTPANGDGNKILVLNAQTLVIEHTYTLPFVASNIKDRLCQITYDYDRNVYYGFTANGIYTISKAFTIIKFTSAVAFDALKIMPDDAEYFDNVYANGFVYYKDRLYVILQYLNNPRNSWMIVLNLDGSIYTTYTCPSVNPNSEYEGICVIDDLPHIFCQYNFFAEFACIFQDKNTLIQKFISAGDDLDNYIVEGRYLVTSDDAATVLHSPISAVPFDLEVFYVNTQLCQRISLGQNGVIVKFNRSYTMSTHSWQAWKVEGCLNMIMAGNTVKLAGAYAGFTTSGGAIAFDVHNWNVMATSSHPISGTTADYTIGFYNESEPGQTFNPSNSSIAFTNKDNCIRIVVTPNTPLSFTNKPLTVNANKLDITHN